MDTLREIFEQQKTFYEEMLKGQEVSRSAFAQLILDSTNKRTDSLLSESQELKVNLKYSQSDIVDIKNNLVKYSEEEGQPAKTGL